MNERGRLCAFFVPVILMLFMTACSYEQSYVKGEDIRSKARFVAVLPLVNLTSYPQAGRIVGDILTTELYAQTNFKIVERSSMIERLRGTSEDLDRAVDRAVALKAGRDLGVDTVIYGSVSEYRYKRGLDEDPVVGINILMLDVKTDRVLWAGSKSDTGGCFWFCEDSLNRLTQEICHDMVKTMLNRR